MLVPLLLTPLFKLLLPFTDVEDIWFCNLLRFLIDFPDAPLATLFITEELEVAREVVAVIKRVSLI